MRGEENNGAINRIHARQRQEFLYEERTRKKRGEKENVEKEERGDKTTDKQQLRNFLDETTHATTGNKSKDKTQDAS
jgi:hypothetical protein